MADQQEVPRLSESVMANWFPLFRGSLFGRYMDALHAARSGLDQAQAEALIFQTPFLPRPGDAYRHSARYRSWCALLERSGFQVPASAADELELLIAWGLFRRLPDGRLQDVTEPPLPGSVLAMRDD